MRRHFLTLILLISACATVDEEHAILVKTFKGYQSSLLQDDGNIAVGFLSDRTVQYYADLVTRARFMPEESLRKEPFLDRFLVLKIRDEFEPDQLAALTGQELLTYAIKHSWIDKEGTAKLEVHKITVKGDFAAIRLKQGNKKIPVPYDAYKEDGKWALDLTSTLGQLNVLFAQIAAEAGWTEDEFIDQTLIGSGSSEGLTDKLWIPPEAQ